jgi:hypothetical protein
MADFLGSGVPQIVVGLGNGTVLAYDPATRVELARVTVRSPLVALACADLDGDGKAELIASDAVGLFVYDAASGALEWSLATAGGGSLAVGNVDADAALEIVSTGYGGKGYVVDGVSHLVEWEYLNGFGAQVKLGDLDGDGKSEIVGASSWYKITTFDAARKTPLWEVTTSHDIDSLLVADADGDGVAEIIYGDGQSGGLHAIGALTHAQKWAIYNSDGGLSGIAVADLDRDGKKEVLWGSGGNSTGADHLYVADPVTGSVKWKSVDIGGPFGAIAVGDLDGDGGDEVVMVSYNSDSGYSEGMVHIFDARTHLLKYQGKLGIMDWQGARTVALGDVDGDGKTEYLVTTGYLYDGVIRVYDGTTHALKKESARYGGNYFTSLALGDVDGDGSIEIVAGQGSGGRGSYLVVLDGATLQEKWRSIDLMGPVSDLKLADTGGDGHQDIIAAVGGAKLYVFDGVTHDLKALMAVPARSLEIADLNGDGARELLVGRSDGGIDVLDLKTLALKKSVVNLGYSPIDALKVADLTGAGSGEWLFAAGGKLTVLDAAGGLKWRSTDLTSNLGLLNHLVLRDTNRDGALEIFLGADHALYQFE